MCEDPVVAEKRPPKEVLRRRWHVSIGRSKLRMLTQQLLEGIRFAHSRGIAHRNLHCGHLLVDAQKNEGKGQLVIASWAASRGFRDVGKRSPLRSCTVPYYIAPEGLIIPPAQQIDPDSVDETAYDDIEGLGREDEEAEGEKENKKKSVLPKQYTNAVDMWAYGCVYAEFILGSSLFNKFAYYESAEQLDQILCIFKLLGTPNEKTWPDVNIPGWHADMFPKMVTASLLLETDCADEITVFQADLLRRMLTLDPSRRITAHEALHHPYFYSDTEHKDDRTEYEDENAQRLKLPGGETMVQRHVRLVNEKNEEEDLFGIVSKFEQSSCRNFHRYHVTFDAKETPCRWLRWFLSRLHWRYKKSPMMKK